MWIVPRFWSSAVFFHLELDLRVTFMSCFLSRFRYDAFHLGIYVIQVLENSIYQWSSYVENLSSYQLEVSYINEHSKSQRTTLAPVLQMNFIGSQKIWCNSSFLIWMNEIYFLKIRSGSTQLFMSFYFSQYFGVLVIYFDILYCPI